MKRLLLILLAMLTVLSAIACTSTTYRTDVAAAALADTAVSALNDGKDYTAADTDFLDSYFSLPTYVTDSVIRFSTDGNDLNEFGIYQVTDGNADSMKALLSGYLTEFYELYNANYLPEETPKLRDAEVRVFGNYVAYAMLNETDRATFFNTIENALKQ